MHNVNVEAVERTAAAAAGDPTAVVQNVAFGGEWQTTPGAPQFRTEIPLPSGKTVIFEADFPPPMGGSGTAPNPLAYCFWGGLACYAMSYAQEAARQGVELRALRARVEAKVDMSRALGVSENPPVERIDWQLEVDADATPAHPARRPRGGLTSTTEKESHHGRHELREQHRRPRATDHRRTGADRHRPRRRRPAARHRPARRPQDHRGPRTEHTMSFTASARSTDGTLRHEVDVNGRHTIVTDEPLSLGGTDTGPAPHELLPATLASCISTMIVLYAQRKQWDLGDVRVDVEYDYQAEPRRFEVTVHLPAGLTEDQVTRLRRVANTCPVRRALEGAFVFEERILITEPVASAGHV
jgi:putative redox protein